MNNARERLNTLLRSLGEKIKLGDLALDDQGDISLAIDGETYTLQYFKGGEAYIVHRLGLLPAEAEMRAAVSAWLLERNCFFRGTGPGVLGVNPMEGGEDAIFYCVRLPLYKLEYAGFEAFLLAAANLTARLRRELAELLGRTKTSPTEREAANHFLRV